MKNPAAVSLGKLALGIKKKISLAESLARAERLKRARRKRWAKIS
jgi:hypothetical protein